MWRPAELTTADEPTRRRRRALALIAIAGALAMLSWLVLDRALPPRTGAEYGVSTEAVGPMPPQLHEVYRRDDCGNGARPLCDGGVIVVGSRAGAPAADVLGLVAAHLRARGYRVYDDEGVVVGRSDEASVFVEPLAVAARRDRAYLSLPGVRGNESSLAVLTISAVPVAKGAGS